MKKRLVCLLLLLTLLLTGCTAQSQENEPDAATSTATDPNVRTTGTGFYFDTVVTFTLYGADATLMDDLQSACRRYENLLSRIHCRQRRGRTTPRGAKRLPWTPKPRIFSPAPWRSAA